MEKEIEKYFFKKIEELGGLCYKFTSPSKRGVPDRIVIFNGLVVFVELKRPGEKLRILQLLIHTRMRERGAIVVTIDSKKEVDEFCEKLEMLGREDSAGDIARLSELFR